MTGKARSYDPFYAVGKIRRFTPQRAFDAKVAIVLSTSEGSNPVVVVGPVGLTLVDALDGINSASRDRVYTRAERIAFGVVGLRDGGYHSSRGGGVTFGTGSLSLLADAGATRDASEDEAERDTAAWMVVAQDGRRTLAVCPKDLDSFGVADLVAPTQRGSFYVELVASGTLFGRDDLVAPGSVLGTDAGHSFDTTRGALATP